MLLEIEKTGFRGKKKGFWFCCLFLIIKFEGK